MKEHVFKKFLFVLKEKGRTLQQKEMTIENVIDWSIGKCTSRKIINMKSDLESGKKCKVQIYNKKNHVLIVPLY